MKILVVCPNLPVPLDNGASIRTFNLIKGLSQTVEIDIISLQSGEIQQRDISLLKNYCRRVLLVPWANKPKILQAGSVVKKCLTGEPFDAKYTDSDALKKQLYKVTGDDHYDIVAFEHSTSAKLRDALHPQHGAKTVLSMHNTVFEQIYRVYKYTPNLSRKFMLLLTWLPMRNWEPKMVARFDKGISVSESDKNLLLSRNPDLDIAVIPNGIDTIDYRPFPLTGRKKNLLFVGAMHYHPNVDGVFFFYHEIFPLVKKYQPECTLTIIGRNPPPDLQRLNNETQVMVNGLVDDVKPYYQKALISVVPLRAGGGTRLKILEAMALGTPVVSTSIGCEGLEVKNGENILIADEPLAFAQRVIDLMTDIELWNRLSVNGRDLVEKNYDWEKISSKYHAILKNLTARP